MNEKLNCGLIGKKLSHSYSPLIHSYLYDYNYSLFEIEEDKLEDFIKNDNFDGANVTIPYKVEVMKYLDEISSEAKRIGCVNTIVRKDNKLYGYNTDYFGFRYLIEKNNFEIKGKNILILGTGGSSKTIYTVCRDMGAKKISFVSRSGKINYENSHILEPDTNIIINCTPVGMYPDCGKCNIDISKFPDLCGVVDIIFNPAKTKLLLDAERLNIKYANGLLMLTAQAFFASEFFTGETLNADLIDTITEKIEKLTKNIILIGMPGCGKSSLGECLSSKLNRELFDSDSEVIKLAGMDIPTIFKEFGEDKFREYEHEALITLTKKSGCIISTGGGAPTKEFNIDLIRQNSYIVYIKRDIDSLPCDNRPLSHKEKLHEMFLLRDPIYSSIADITVENSGTLENCAEEIIRKLNLK